MKPHLKTMALIMAALALSDFVVRHPVTVWQHALQLAVYSIGLYPATRRMSEGRLSARRYWISAAVSVIVFSVLASIVNPHL